MSLHAATESISSIPKVSDSPSPDVSVNTTLETDAAPATAQEAAPTPPEDTSLQDTQPVPLPEQSTGGGDLPAASDQGEVDAVAAAVSSSEDEAAPEEDSNEREDVPSSQSEPAAAPESQEPAQTAPSASQDSESVSGVASDVVSQSEPVDAPAENPPAAAREGAASDDPESVSVPIGPTTTEQDNSQSAAPNGKAVDGVDVEALQKRLKLVEQRFTGTFENCVCPTVASFVIGTDVSTSFKRLQAEKLAADRVLRELTSVESVTEADALRDFLQNMNFKNEVSKHDALCMLSRD